MKKTKREFDAVLEPGRARWGGRLRVCRLYPPRCGRRWCGCGSGGDKWISVSDFAISGRSGAFYLLLNKAMKNRAVVAWGLGGEVAGFQLEPDFEDRPAELPDVLFSFAGGSFWIADQVRRAR